MWEQGGEERGRKRKKERERKRQKERKRERETESKRGEVYAYKDSETEKGTKREGQFEMDKNLRQIRRGRD